MQMQLIISLIVLWCALTVLLPGQITDWQSFFRHLVSSDPAIVEAASEKFPALMEELGKATPDSLSEDIAAIVDVLENGKEEMRLQASAVLVGISMGRRRDSGIILENAVPTLLSLFEDQNAKVRENAVWAIVWLRPQIPGEALPYLLQAVRGERRHENHDATEAAVYGLGRLARENAETVAMDEIANLSSPDQPFPIRYAAAKTVAQIGLDHPAIVENLREMLRDEDENEALVRVALRAVGKIGPGAAALEKEIERIAEETDDPRLKSMAVAALQRLKE